MCIVISLAAGVISVRRKPALLPNWRFARLDYLNIRGIFIGIPVNKWLNFRFRVLCLCGFANCVIMLYCFLYTEHWNGFAADNAININPYNFPQL